MPRDHRYFDTVLARSHPEFLDGTQACADIDNPEIFFPERPGRDHVRAALDVCAVCPLEDACLEYALASTQQHGIWGGTTAAQRVSILKKRGGTE